jgi:tRNA threonylcarbamoyladenosine biosynthesis protein TsaB
MNVIALDTAGPLPAVAVLAGGAVHEEPLPADRHASEKLLETLARALERSGVSLSSCERIAVCSGPGSFTGLRVGLSTAWGLGRALEIPVEEVSTLEALAEASRPELPTSTRVTTALDAGRGEVVAAEFSLEGTRVRALGSSRRVGREEASRWSGPIAALPAGLLGDAAVAPRSSLALSLALAVSAAPREAAGPRGRAPRAIYSRPSAAEEKRGAP